MKIGNLEVYGVIYKIENKTNGKVYIGQTIQGFCKRYKYSGDTDIERVYKYHIALYDNNDMSYNSHLLRSIKKYGFSNFSVNKIFDIAFSKDELDVKEMSWVSVYNSYKNGYNQNLGGNGNNGLFGINNPYAKSVIQLSLEGKFIKQWDSLADVERELDINKTHICGVCNDNYGRKSSGGFMWIYEDEYYDFKDDLELIYNNQTGEYNKNPIVQLSLHGEYIQEFESMAQATRYVHGSSVDKISKCCKGERKSHLDYIWVYKENYSKDNYYNWEGIHNGKPKEVIQLSLEGTFIKEYTSISEASECVENAMTSKISSCCNGIRKSHANFIWIFKSDYSKCIDYKLNAKHTGKPKEIVQLSLDEVFIKEYESVSNAGDENGISKKAISKCLIGKSKTSGGFIWKYKENYNIVV